MDGIGSGPRSPNAGEGPRLTAAGPRRTSLREAVEAATERVKEIIDAAERVADEIHRDAEAEAERYLAERRREADGLVRQHRERLEGVLSTLRERLGGLEAQGRGLIADVERAIADVEGRKRAAETDADSHRERPDPDRGRDSGVPGDAPVADPEMSTGGEPAPASGRPRTAGELRERALIRATQMAVGGADRDRIEATLRDELGIDDPAPIVDEVLPD